MVLDILLCLVYVRNHGVIIQLFCCIIHPLGVIRQQNRQSKSVLSNNKLAVTQLLLAGEREHNEKRRYHNCGSMGVIFLVVGILAVRSAIEAAAEVLAAIVSAAALLLGGILTHALTVIREQHLQQQREKQKNYERLIESIDKVIRKPGPTSDDFAKIHLESWVVGSPDVIKHTQELLVGKEPSERKKAVEELLLSMMKDLGLPLPSSKLELKGVFEKQESGFLNDSSFRS
jgi:hypothetical protein